MCVLFVWLFGSDHHHLYPVIRKILFVCFFPFGFSEMKWIFLFFPTKQIKCVCFDYDNLLLLCFWWLMFSITTKKTTIMMMMMWFSLLVYGVCVCGVLFDGMFVNGMNDWTKEKIKIFFRLFVCCLVIVVWFCVLIIIIIDFHRIYKESFTIHTTHAYLELFWTKKKKKDWKKAFDSLTRKHFCNH